MQVTELLMKEQKEMFPHKEQEGWRHTFETEENIQKSRKQKVSFFFTLDELQVVSKKCHFLTEFRNAKRKRESESEIYIATK